MPDVVYTVAMIGFGYWGQVLARNFASQPRFYLKYICDRHEERATAAAMAAPGSQFTTDAAPLFSDPAVDVVIIATQAATHAPLIKRALDHNKHVFVEKPLCLDVAAAVSFCERAKAQDRVIWVDHTFLFTPAYTVLKERLTAGAIGKPWRFHSMRTAFGLFQHDANIIWHLMYHDAYLLLDLFPQRPLHITAAGSAHVIPGMIDAANVTLTYADGFQATILNDMTFPIKKREIIVTGSDGSLIWDENSAVKLAESRHQATLDPATGKIIYDKPTPPTAMPCETGEALARELQAFASHLDHRADAPCAGEKALQTMRLVAMMATAAETHSCEGPAVL